MHPESHDNDQWNRPTERSSAAPYSPQPDDGTEPSTPVQPTTAVSPVVTMQPDDEPSAPVSAANAAAEPELPDDDTPIVRWQGHEYIHRDKDGLWYVVFTVITLALMALAIFLMHALTFAILVPVMAIALVVYSQRPPRLLEYILSPQGLHVNDRLYSFAEFKSFAVIHGDDEYSIMLVPTKRFRVGVTVYFPGDKGEAIVDALAARLPMEEAHLDIVDQIIRKLRI